MKIRTLALTGIAMTAALALSSAANALVIAGPTLTSPGGGWSVTGLGFHANANSTLTGFTYQNQGAADTVVLTDVAGNILQSLSTPGASTSYVASVSWALTAGSDYWLLQTIVSNELFEFFNDVLPSNADIAITKSGTFAMSIPQAIGGSDGFPNNFYWAAFNDITTSGGTVPEPASWAMMIAGFGMVGGALRRRATTVTA